MRRMLVEVAVGVAIPLVVMFAAWTATTLVKILQNTSVIGSVVTHHTGEIADHEARLRVLEQDGNHWKNNSRQR